MTSIAANDRAFHAFAEHAVDGVIIGAPDGRIFYANQAACEVFEATADELCRVGLQGISNPDDAVWQATLAERRYNGSVRGLVPMFRLDGTPLIVEASSAIFEGPDGAEHTCVITRDVTDRVRAERRLVAYDEITETLLAGAEIAEVLELVARHACTIFDATLASIVIPARDEPGVVIVAAYGSAAAGLTGRTLPPGGLPEEVMTSRRPRLLADITHATRTSGIRDLDLGPGMIVPIISGETAFGALCVGTRPGRHPYRTEDLDSAIQYAARAGIAFAMGRARTGIESRQRRTNEQLQRALDTRVIIEQAKGFLACLGNIDTDEAFDRLRKYAQTNNIDIQTTARRVLDRQLFL